MTPTKISRKELLKKEDEFITFSSRMIILAKEHSRELKFLGMGVVCLLLIYLGINTYLRYVNKKGQDAYNIAYYAISKNMNSEKDQDSIIYASKLTAFYSDCIDKEISVKFGDIELSNSILVQKITRQEVDKYNIVNL